jgi:hypothetical protein
MTENGGEQQPQEQPAPKAPPVIPLDPDYIERDNPGGDVETRQR